MGILCSEKLMCTHATNIVRLKIDSYRFNNCWMSSFLLRINVETMLQTQMTWDVETEVYLFLCDLSHSKICSLRIGKVKPRHWSSRGHGKRFRQANAYTEKHANMCLKGPLLWNSREFRKVTVHKRNELVLKAYSIAWA